MQLVVLGAEDVRAAVDMPTAVELMARAFSALSRGEALVPQRAALETDLGTTLVMPAWLPPAGSDDACLGAKVVSVRPENRAVGLPVVHGAVLILDPDTGAPAALLDGATLTALRTGAATGLATRLLAREEARVLTVFGAGAQAPWQIEAVRAVRPIEEVRVVSAAGASARALARALGVDARAVDDPTDAVRGADVIVAATSSETPVFPGAAVDEGAHVNGVGSYTPRMREVDGTLVARALVVVDSLEAARVEAGDLIGAVEEGVFGWGQVHGELGDVVDGSRPGRTSASQVTFFKSVGSAVQDMVVAARVLDEARARGLGSTIEI